MIHAGHGSPSHVHDDPADRGKRWYQTGKGKLVIFTALLLAVAWGIELLAPQFGKWAFVAACLIGVAPVAQRAFAALRLGQPFTIESLMTVAAIGALTAAAPVIARARLRKGNTASASGVDRLLAQTPSAWAPASSPGYPGGEPGQQVSA